MRPQHTPTPWFYNRDEGGFQGHSISTADRVICEVIPPYDPGIDDDDEADSIAACNARFIVRACNTHTEVIEALIAAITALNTARRFRVGNTDSYAIASHLERTLANAMGRAR